MAEQLKIVLTDTQPITIAKAAWPVIAEASAKDYDSEFECQSNRTSKWKLTVRQHDRDKRVIVYASYTYTSNWQAERDFYNRAGKFLEYDASPEDICAAIREVCHDIAGMECSGIDADRWDELVRDCTADMPERVVL